MVTTNYTEAEENTLRERVLSKDRSEEEQFLSDTIRKRVGERIYSRLREMCYFEELNGPDLIVGKLIEPSLKQKLSIGVAKIESD